MVIFSFDLNKFTLGRLPGGGLQRVGSRWPSFDRDDDMLSLGVVL